MSVWNGRYECTCYHPLFVFNQFGGLERCALSLRRPGIKGARLCRDSAPRSASKRPPKPSALCTLPGRIANPEVYGYLEGEGIKYAIRLPANRVSGAFFKPEGSL